MTREQSRLECGELVAALDLPDPFDLAEFCARFGRQIDRDIVLMSHSMAIGGLCGTWMRTAKADYVFYEKNTSQLHQQHIVFHELGTSCVATSQARNSARISLATWRPA